MCSKKSYLIAKVFISGEMRTEIESHIAVLQKPSIWKCVLETLLELQWTED